MTDMKFDNKVLQYHEFMKFDKGDNYCYRCKVALENYNPYDSAENQKKFRSQGDYNDDALHWGVTAGYGSPLDGLEQSLVLCLNCTYELLGPYIKVRDSFYPQENRAARLHQRDKDGGVQRIQGRWDARKSRRALQRSLLGGTPAKETEKSKI